MLPPDGDPELRVFDPVIRLLHWLTLLLVAAIFLLAFSIDFSASREEALALTQLHRSFGLTAWVVMLGRLVWRQFARFPNWPADMPQAMRFAKQWGECALYALMLTQPVLGLLHTNAHGDRVSLFFLGRLPTLIGENRLLAKQLMGAHRTVGLLLLGLIALHAGAALYHHFWRRDETLRAMLPNRMRCRAARAKAAASGSRSSLHSPADCRTAAGINPGAPRSGSAPHTTPFRRERWPIVTRAAYRATGRSTAAGSSSAWAGPGPASSGA